MTTTVKQSELALGDTVRLSPGCDPFRDATVKQVADGCVTLFRPFVNTADFSYTGGVCCYIGIEEWKIPANDGPIELVRPGRPLK